MLLQQQQLEEQVKFVNTHKQFAAVVLQDVYIQNKVNAARYTQATMQRATQLQQQLANLFNAKTFLNIRAKFIAVKVHNAAQQLNSKSKMQQLLQIAAQQKAELVLTNTNAIILRIR